MVYESKDSKMCSWKTSYIALLDLQDKYLKIRPLKNRSLKSICVPKFDWPYNDWLSLTPVILPKEETMDDAEQLQTQKEPLSIDNLNLKVGNIIIEFKSVF